jgi:putative transcriptional regulator
MYFMTKESIKNNVFELRSKKSVTQEEMARALGVTRQTIIAIEKGNYVPSVLLSLKIAQFFHMRIEDIFKIS